jgi:hypothetical protein
MGEIVANRGNHSFQVRVLRYDGAIIKDELKAEIVSDQTEGFRQREDPK